MTPPLAGFLLMSGLTAATIYFIWRGIWRALQKSTDLLVGYSAARAWLHGGNPYDAAVLKEELITGGGAALLRQLDVLANFYFPTTIPLFVAVGWMPWTAAKLAWLGLNIAGVLLMALGLVRFCDWRWIEPRAIGLTAFVLALAPVHTTMSEGQTSILAVAPLVGAVLLERRGRANAAGALYGLATAVKVQIGLPFVAYAMWRRRWPTAATAVTLLAGLTLISVLRMEAADIAWREAWSANLASLWAPGAYNDPSGQGPNRSSLINLQYLLHQFIDDRAVVDAIAFTVVGVGAVAVVLKARHPSQHLLALSAIGILCLLGTYHRYYDAVLLVFAAGWAFSTLRTEHHRLAIIVLVACGTYLVPGQTMLRTLHRQGDVPAWLTTSFVWEFVLMTQHVWALIVAFVVLLYVATDTSKRWQNRT